MNRHESKRNTRHKNTNDPQNSTALERSVTIFYWKASIGFTAPTLPLVQMWIKTSRRLVCMKDPKPVNASSPKTLYQDIRKGDKAKI